MNVLSLIVLKGDIHKDYDKGRVSQIVTKKRSTKRNEKREFLVVEFYTPEKSFYRKSSTESVELVKDMVLLH